MERLGLDLVEILQGSLRVASVGNIRLAPGSALLLNYLSRLPFFSGRDTATAQKLIH